MATKQQNEEIWSIATKAMAVRQRGASTFDSLQMKSIEPSRPKTEPLREGQNDPISPLHSALRFKGKNGPWGVVPDGKPRYCWEEPRLAACAEEQAPPPSAPTPPPPAAILQWKVDSSGSGDGWAICVDGASPRRTNDLATQPDQCAPPTVDGTPIASGIVCDLEGGISPPSPSLADCDNSAAPPGESAACDASLCQYEGCNDKPCDDDNSGLTGDFCVNGKIAVHCYRCQCHYWDRANMLGKYDRGNPNPRCPPPPPDWPGAELRPPTATDSKPGTGFELKESRCADDSRIESEDDCKEAAANKGVPWGGCIHASCPGLKLPSTAFPPGCVLQEFLRPPELQELVTYAYFNSQTGWPYTPSMDNHKGELCYEDLGSAATDSKATDPGTGYDAGFTWVGTHDEHAAGLFLHGQYGAVDDAQKRVLCAQYCFENGYEPGWISFADNDCCGRGECPCTSETMVPGTASADRQCGCVAKGTDCSVAANQRPLLAARIYKVHERLCGEQLPSGHYRLDASWLHPGPARAYLIGGRAFLAMFVAPSLTLLAAAIAFFCALTVRRGGCGAAPAPEAGSGTAAKAAAQGSWCVVAFGCLSILLLLAALGASIAAAARGCTTSELVYPTFECAPLLPLWWAGLFLQSLTITGVGPLVASQWPSVAASGEFATREARVARYGFGISGATLLWAVASVAVTANVRYGKTGTALAYSCVVLAGALVGTVTTGAVGGVVCHSRVVCRSRGARPPLMRQVVDFCCCCLCCAGLHLSAGASGGGGGSRVAFGALLVTSVLEIVGVVGLASVFGDTFTLWNEVVLVLGAAASAAAALLLVASLFAKSPAARDEDRQGMIAASRRVDELEAKLSQMVDQQAQLLELLQRQQSAQSAA